MKLYVIWDKCDNVVHRGPWTKKACRSWMAFAREVFPRPAGVNEVWDIRPAVKVAEKGGLTHFFRRALTKIKDVV
jgi:hypothetical protein